MFTTFYSNLEQLEQILQVLIMKNNQLYDLEDELQPFLEGFKTAQNLELQASTSQEHWWMTITLNLEKERERLLNRIKDKLTMSNVEMQEANARLTQIQEELKQIDEARALREAQKLEKDEEFT